MEDEEAEEEEDWEAEEETFVLQVAKRAQQASRVRAGADNQAKATFHEVVGVSWQAAESFAVERGLTLVNSDGGGKSSEHLAADKEYPRGVLGKAMGASVIERCGFLLCDLLAAAAAHKTAERQVRAESKRNKEESPTAALARAQASKASEADRLSSNEAASNALRQDIYDTAMELFQRTKQAKANPHQRDKLWNDAEKEARKQVESEQQQQCQGQHQPDVRARPRRRTRVRVGNDWLDLS